MIPSNSTITWTPDGVVVSTHYPAQGAEGQRDELRVFTDWTQLKAHLYTLWVDKQ